MWEAAVGKELHCTREAGNCQVPFTVALVRSTVVVGHVPKKILCVIHVSLTGWYNPVQSDGV